MIFDSHSRTQSAGNSEAQRIECIRQACFNLALALDKAGFNVEYLTPYVKVTTPTDMDGFPSSHAFENFWGVFPPGYEGYPADSRPVGLIVDDTSPGYVPNEPFFISRKLGTIDKVAVHAAVVELMVSQMTAYYAPNPVGIIYQTNVPIPTTYISVQVPFEPWPFSKSPIGNNLPSSMPGNALFTEGGGQTAVGSGGYSCAGAGCVLTIQQDGKDNTRYMQVCFSPATLRQPIDVTTTPGVDRTALIPFRLDSTDWLIAAASDYCSIAANGNALGGAGAEHLDMARLRLPLPTTSRAYFATVGRSSDETSFRIRPQCSGTRLVNDGEGPKYGSSGGFGEINAPRVMTLWDETAQAPAQWLNGLGQMTEAWIGFMNDEGDPAPLLGKHPGAMVVHKYMGDGSPFMWDGVPWKVYTIQAEGQAGTMLFRYPQGPPGAVIVEGDCP